MVKNWNKRTPDNFRFTAKFPKIITHDKKFKNVEKDLELFYQRMEPLKDKLLALLIQLPPSYKLKEGLEDFSSHDFFFEGDFRYAIEVRHSSWFSDLAYNFFKNNNIAMNVDVAKINRDLNSEPRFNLGGRYQGKKSKQTSISDFVN